MRKKFESKTRSCNIRLNDHHFGGQQKFFTKAPRGRFSLGFTVNLTEPWLPGSLLAESGRDRVEQNSITPWRRIFKYLETKSLILDYFPYLCIKFTHSGVLSALDNEVFLNV